MAIPHQIGIRELKDHLSATLRRVRRGETVTVTDRDSAIARIVPVRLDGDDAETVVRALTRSGRLSWSGGKPRGVRAPGQVRGSSVSDAVIEDRR